MTIKTRKIKVLVNLRNLNYQCVDIIDSLTDFFVLSLCTKQKPWDIGFKHFMLTGNITPVTPALKEHGYLVGRGSIK